MIDFIIVVLIFGALALLHLLIARWSVDGCPDLDPFLVPGRSAPEL